MSIARGSSLSEYEQVVSNSYYYWLMDIIDLDSYEKRTNLKYWFLMKTLYYKDFYWTIELDSNRGKDGQALRNEFKNEVYFENYDAIDGPCSVLEMLIALAGRFDGNGSFDYGDETDTSKHFWEMIENLGLDLYDDNWFYDDSVDDILDRWLDRDYEFDGRGGLFPLKNPPKDQRNVEIWYQMQSYIQENDEKLP